MSNRPAEDDARRDDELLLRVATGELAADAPEAAARVRESPEFRAALAQTVEAMQALDRAGSEARATIAAAPREAAVPLHEARREIEAELARSRRAPRRIWIALAAAVLIAALLPWWQQRSRPARLDPLLGAPVLTWKLPSTPLVAGARVAWQCDLPPGGYFELTLLDATASQERELFRRRIEEPAWSPTPAELQQLPDRVVVQVAARLRDGSLQGSSRVTLSVR